MELISQRFVRNRYVLIGHNDNTVYKTGQNVVRGVEWSKVLNEQFQKNMENDPTLKWQYFGSTQGFFRIYPGFQWKMVTEYGHPNIYDCRSQIW